MCKAMEDRINATLKESRIESAQEMLRDGVPLEKIAKYSKLSVGEVKKLRDGRMV